MCSLGHRPSHRGTRDGGGLFCGPHRFRETESGGGPRPVSVSGGLVLTGPRDFGGLQPPGGLPFQRFRPANFGLDLRVGVGCLRVANGHGDFPFGLFHAKKPTAPRRLSLKSRNDGGREQGARFGGRTLGGGPPHNPLAGLRKDLAQLMFPRGNARLAVAMPCGAGRYFPRPPSGGGGGTGFNLSGVNRENRVRTGRQPQGVRGQRGERPIFLSSQVGRPMHLETVGSP